MNEFWWWANSDGALKTVEQAELELALSKGAIAPRTYVWKSGWAEWLRATQVAELQSLLPKDLVSSPQRPRLDPDATHPPPVPVDTKAGGTSALDPIIPVASNPQNDKPGTLLLVETELDAAELQPAGARPPPPPSRRNGMNGNNGKSSLPPIVPVPSNVENDRPETQVLADSEILIEEEAPPVDAWSEVGRKSSAPPPPSARPPSAPPRPDKPSGSALVGRPIIGIKAPAPAAPRPEPTAPQAAPTEPQASVPTAPQAPPTAPQTSAPTAPQAAPPAAAAAALVGRAGAAAPPAPPPQNPIVPVPDPEDEGPTIAMEPIVPVSEPDNEAPTAIHPAALKDESPLPAWDIDADGTVENAPQWPAPGQHAYSASPSYPPPKKSRLPLVIGTIGVLGLFGIAAVGVGLYLTKPWESAADEAPTPATATAAPTPAEPAKPEASTAACVVHAEAKRIAPSAVVSVPVAMATAPGGSQVAVGFADSTTGAAGITVDTKTLAVKAPFSRAGTRSVVGVVPLVQSGTLSFEADRDGGELERARTIDAASPFTIGLGPDGYSRVVDNGQPETIWSDAAGEKTTEPRVASVDGVGHVVTFRRGGRDGEIRVGWLTPDGKKKTGLSTVSAQGPRVGTPSVAAGEHGVLVAFAARPSDGAPWNVRLALAKPESVPTSSNAFELPAGGPGTEAISPTASALPGKRWLLQWTEGKAGQRTVRAQTLDAELRPLGKPIELSPKGVEAGQGAIAVAGEHAVTTFLVKSATGYELWASSLSCR